MSLVIGVDPGLSGAIAFYDSQSQKLIRVDDMPVVVTASGPAGRKAKERRQIDPYALAILIDGYCRHTSLAVVEDVSGGCYVDSSGQRRGQGSASSFNFGKADGIVIGVLACCMIPTNFVRPAVWKALMNLSSDKDKSRELASELFPDFKNSWLRKKDDGRAEASLLAFFGSKRLMP